MLPTTSLYTQINDASKYLSDPDLRRKMHCLLRGLKSKNVELTCREFGICRSTFYNWLRRLKGADFSPESLHPRSSRPFSHPRMITGEKKTAIVSLREEFHYCPSRIAWHLNEAGHVVSANGVYKVLRREGAVFRKRRGKKPNRHTKRYELDRPGQGFQLDIKYVPFLIEGKKTYLFSAIDDCTRWRFSYAYWNLGYDPALDFVRRLVKAAPFSIESIQTDNGLEFTNRFHRQTPGQEIAHPFPTLLETLHILHKLIPPGLKELNGKIERLHQTDDREFFWKLPRSITLKNFLKELERWTFDYNHFRPHSSLGMRTPMQRLEDFGFQPRSTLRRLQSEEAKPYVPPVVAVALRLQKEGYDVSHLKARIHVHPQRHLSTLERAKTYAFLSSTPLPPLCNTCGDSTLMAIFVM